VQHHWPCVPRESATLEINWKSQEARTTEPDDLIKYTPLDAFNADCCTWEQLSPNTSSATEEMLRWPSEIETSYLIGNVAEIRAVMEESEVHEDNINIEDKLTTGDKSKLPKLDPNTVMTALLTNDTDCGTNDEIVGAVKEIEGNCAKVFSTCRRGRTLAPNNLDMLASKRVSDFHSTGNCRFDTIKERDDDCNSPKNIPDTVKVDWIPTGNVNELSAVTMGLKYENELLTTPTALSTLRTNAWLTPAPGGNFEIMLLSEIQVA
jgi:hypothetical protein